MKQRGSAAVELALVLPLVLLAALALLQVGLLGRDMLVVTQAAREGARAAAVTTEEAAIREAVARLGLDPSRTQVEIDRSGSVGEPVSLVVRYRAPVIVPFVGRMFSRDVTLDARFTMRQETADV